MRLKHFTAVLKFVLSVVNGIYCSNFTVSVLDGEDALLPCILPPKLAENNTVYWQYEEEVLSGGNITVSNKDSRFSLYRPYDSDWYLQISPAKMKDEGTYNCLVGDLFYSSANLIVESPPFITGYDTDKLYLQVCNTARVTLYCNVTGRPRPTIQWYKQTANNKLKYLELNIESIFIPEVKHSNAGVYLCKVSNSYGKAGMEFHLTVTDLVTVLNKVGASNAPRQDHTAASSTTIPCEKTISCYMTFIFVAGAHIFMQLIYT